MWKRQYNRFFVVVNSVYNRNVYFVFGIATAKDGEKKFVGRK